jgi:hypothetical protein
VIAAFPLRATLALAGAALFEPADGKTVFDVHLGDVVHEGLAPRVMKARLIDCFEALHPLGATFYEERGSEQGIVLQIRDYARFPVNGDVQRALHEIMSLRSPDFFYRFVADAARVDKRFMTLSVVRPCLEMYRDYITGD